MSSILHRPLNHTLREYLRVTTFIAWTIYSRRLPPPLRPRPRVLFRQTTRVPLEFRVAPRTQSQAPIAQSPCSKLDCKVDLKLDSKICPLGYSCTSREGPLERERYFVPCFRSGSVVQVETTLLGLAKQGALQEKTGRYSLSTLYLAMPKTTVHVVDSMVTTPAHVAKASRL